MIKGEAIVLFAGRRGYAKLFHAQVDTSGPPRSNRPVMLAPPFPQQLQAELNGTADLVRTLVSGEARFGVEPEGPVLAALLGAFASSLKAGAGARAAAQAACEAAGKAHREGTEGGQIKRPGGKGAEPPVTDLLPMLEMLAAKVADQDTTAAGLPANPVSADLMRALVAIETASGCSPQLARRRSLTVLAERDRCSGLHLSAGWLALVGLIWLMLAGIIGCAWLTLRDPRRTLAATGLHLSALAHARWD